MHRGIEAIEKFMESVGLAWHPGSTERAELKVSYRIGNTRPLGIDRTLVEFHCDPKRAKVKQRRANPQDSALQQLAGARRPAELVVAPAPHVPDDEGG